MRPNFGNSDFEYQIVNFVKFILHSSRIMIVLQAKDSKPESKLYLRWFNSNRAQRKMKY